jgi:hypothetical protein
MYVYVCMKRKGKNKKQQWEDLFQVHKHTAKKESVT